MRCKPEGPLDARIVLVGEAPGEQEEREGRPFRGASGKELDLMLAEAGLNREELYLTNVFLDRPPGNKLVENWCCGKKELPADYTLAAMQKGKYLRPEYAHELTRLHEELAALKPHVIVALGGTALWALTGQSGISALRGTVIEHPLGKILPTFHPAYILRNWPDRLILVADLLKAKKHSQARSFTRPVRKVLINPTIQEIEDFYQAFLIHAPLISTDVETKGKQITCVGFAPTPNLALVIPFWNESQPNYSYWPSLAEEIRAWAIVRKVVEGPSKLLFQNGLYDMQYFIRHGMRVRNAVEDTMILHHSLFPELQKGLGFLGSMYADEPAWKLMRQRKGDDLVKRDE